MSATVKATGQITLSGSAQEVTPGAGPGQGVQATVAVTAATAHDCYWGWTSGVTTGNGDRIPAGTTKAITLGPADRIFVIGTASDVVTYGISAW